MNVGRLTDHEALTALVQPSLNVGVAWTREAADQALRTAQGNPWRIQQIGDACWSEARHSGAPIAQGSTIDAPLVGRASEKVLESLTTGSFTSRWTNATPTERAYLTAMAQSMAQDGSSRTRHVDALMHRTPKANSDVRASLINKGLITGEQRGEVRFSAPGFDQFILERQGVGRIEAQIIDARARSAITHPPTSRELSAGPQGDRSSPRAVRGKGEGPEIER